MSASITIFPYANRWVVNIPAMPGRNRERKFFIEKEDAETYRAQKEHQLAEHGRRGLSADGVTVNKAIEKFFALKEMDARHRRDARHALGLFKAEYGAILMDQIGPIDLAAFWKKTKKNRETGKMEPKWSKTTQARLYRYLRLFFNFCERYEVIEKNPIRRVEPPKADDPKKNILTPAEMVELLKVEDEQFHAFLCLGGFIGIRTSELLKLKVEDIEEKEVCVNRGHREQRFVARTDAFNANWKGMPKFYSLSKFYEHVRDLRKGKHWPDNCLRHSFGSYHLAMWENAASTSHQMGNSEKVVKKDYARAVPKKQAAAWWSIGVPPVEEGKVTPLPRQAA